MKDKQLKFIVVELTVEEVADTRQEKEALHLKKKLVIILLESR